MKNNVGKKKRDSDLSLPVAVVTTSFPVEPGLISGVFIEKLALHLSERAEITVVAPEFDRPESFRSDPTYRLCCFQYAPRAWQKLAHSPGGIPVALRRQPLYYLLLPVFFASMFVACLRVSRTVSLVHANWSINGVVAGLAGWISGVPVVTTLRGTDANALRSSKVQRMVLRACLFLSCKIVTVSDAIQIYLADNFPEYSDKLMTIPNGVDERLLQIPLKRDKASVCRLLSVGNLVSNKGVATIVDALSRLSDNALHLKIVGEGVERTNLKNAITAYGLENKVFLLGALPPDDVAGELGASDIFVLASFSEGRPNVILEAMAAGTPVIASNIEGVRELIEDGENGLLFEAGNSRHLAECIVRLSSDSGLRAQLSEAARNFIVRNDLLWNTTARKYIDLYREITKDPD